MASRVIFSGENLGLFDIDLHQQDLTSSLRLYFSPASPDFSRRFQGYLPAEVKAELSQRIAETELSSSLAMLAAIEAAFRIDYLRRNYNRDRAPISRSFRQIFQLKAHRVALDEDILAIWAYHYASKKSLISELRGAFRFRNWLAHGRYWSPKLGRRYDYYDLYILANATFSGLPFLKS